MWAPSAQINEDNRNRFVYYANIYAYVIFKQFILWNQIIYMDLVDIVKMWDIVCKTFQKFKCYEMIRYLKILGSKDTHKIKCKLKPYTNACMGLN